MKKQFIAKLIVLAMVLAMVPVTVLAASAAGSNLGYGNYGYYSITKDTTVVALPTGNPTSEDDFAIEMTVVDGVADVVVNDSYFEALVKNIKDGKAIVPLKGDGVAVLNFTCSAKALSMVANADADLVLKTSFATITIPNDVLVAAGNVGTARTLVLNTEESISVGIEVAGEMLDPTNINIEEVKA